MARNHPDGHERIHCPGSGTSLYAGARAVPAAGRDYSECPRAARIGNFHFARAELQTARALAEQLLSLAQRMHPLTQPLLGAHLGLGITLFYLGELTSALTHIEQGIALYDPQLHRPDRSQFSTADRKVVGLSYAARVLWDLGYPDQARQKMNEAVTLAGVVAHPFSLVFALSQATGLHTSLQDVQAVQEHAAALTMLAREHGFPYFLAGTAFRQGWILVEQGQAKGGDCTDVSGPACLAGYRRSKGGEAA